MQPVFLAKQACSADIGYGVIDFVAGRTYQDDGTTTFVDFASNSDYFQSADLDPGTEFLSAHHKQQF